MTSRLTIVTGPPGVDIGPAAAHLGRDVGDGLAARIVNSYRDGDGAHTSPDPYHHAPLTDPRVAQGPARLASVRLRYLPSAWQNPDTNLGVVFTGHAHSALKDDIHTLDALGLDPSHRLTVQAHGGHLRRNYTFPLPIEPGNVGVIARDTLRAGGRVIAEAGDGMTFLGALVALHTPPWAPWVEHLDLWVVIDPGGHDAMTAAEAVDRAGGPAGVGRTTVRVYDLGAQAEVRS